MADETIRRLSGLLHTAGETHHVVFANVDGADDDWATFYADWLVNHSDLPEILGRTPVRSELTFELVSLDREYAKERPSEPWEEFYAARLLERLGAP